MASLIAGALMSGLMVMAIGGTTYSGVLGVSNE